MEGVGCVGVQGPGKRAPAGGQRGEGRELQRRELRALMMKANRSSTNVLSALYMKVFQGICAVDLSL